MGTGQTTQATSPAAIGPHDALGRVLADAVTALRVQLGDPFAPITVLMPSGPNTVFARTALALQGPFIRVWFDTPEGLAEAQLPPSFWATHRPEPPGWRRPVVRRILNALADAGELGDAADVVRRPGWLEPLLRALARLEGHGIKATDIAKAAAAVDDIGDRAIILERVLAALTAARSAEGFATDADVTLAATTAVDDVGVGAATARGVIVVGDRELSRSLHTFTTAWLSRRSVVRVQLPALQHLAPTPWGVVDAVHSAHPDVRVMALAAPPGSARRTLHDEPSAFGKGDDDVVVVEELDTNEPRRQHRSGPYPRRRP